MTKDQVRSVLEAQPEEVDVNAFLEELILQEKLAAGEADIAAGRVVSHEEAKHRLARWTE